ncbi:16S rRNA (guanine(527)-N(7))-methyltransferase RsmG [Bordetella genomosp. 11]|uniref:Ribosomal RNA small subunit methyltransferase G n=1 Tax=Bordetella genomosp. 11 TaxID=1416808 RepID=A0A261UMT9_9BORD|nr:16S rRNA (guanine(527)-N(7))-methyltransferase RsmG [Bordetella genomosp. 11]OZI63179.1 16S rRNA (guanine(527)-N(7))-methyltransferase RsmG [Bordetella genomosp. 11]
MTRAPAPVQGADDVRLKQACVALGLSATDEQLSKLLGYLQLLQRWNRTYNLTAIRDPGQMLVQHIFDSLAVVGPLDGVMPADGKLFDIGAGAGLPGVILAIMRPGWKIVCIDAVEKKTAFIRQAAGALALPNLSVLHERVEKLPPGACDVVTSRAFASLDDFARLAGQHVAPGGTLLALKGKVPDDEIARLHAAGEWRVVRIDPVTVPELDAQRCLIWMRRDGARSQGNHESN